MPGDRDRFDAENCFMITMPSRGKFYLYMDVPGDIKIRDIANATSKQCRFTGHMREDDWYSVAEHQVDVSHIIRLLGGTHMEQFCGLMHDSPEAFLSDICAPFKREIGQYYEKEAIIWKRIAAQFNLPEMLPGIVKQADWIALFLEAMTFVVPEHRHLLHDWFGWHEYGRTAELFYEDWCSPKWKFWRTREVMHGWSYKTARLMYLARFQQLSAALCTGCDLERAA